jgi:hypothetical protein
MFRTEVQVKPAVTSLSLRSKLVTLGSCFAEVIGNRLAENKAEVLINPFGTIFNPLSACLLLEAACGKKYDFEQHLVENNGIWYAYDLHSSLSSPSRNELLALIGQKLQQTRNQLQGASLLILTLGTAVGYRLNSTGALVANCHKLPAKNFTRFILSTEEIVAAFERMYPLLRQLNPALNILLTVSPVRHVKETLPLNSVSKSVLRVVCHQLTELHPDVLYFPAYEIMLDDLRDYRFYKQDMIHPTETAEDYIWQKFAAAYFDNEFQKFLEAWARIRSALAHKPFHPATAAHQAFLQRTLQQLQQLEQKYKVDCTIERQFLQQQLLA